MSDINLLPTDASARDEKPKPPQKRGDDDMALHVPAPEPEQKPAPQGGGSFLAQLIEKDAKESATNTPSAIFSQKVEAIPSAPKTDGKPATTSLNVPSTPSVIAQKPMAAPFLKAAPPSNPSIPSAKKLTDHAKGEASEKEPGTLRVSLITSNGGAGLSDLAVRKRQRAFAVIGLLGLLTDGLIFGGLHLRKLSVEKKNADAAKAVQDIDARIAEREKELKSARDFQELSRAAARVLDGHAHWTEVLKLLEERALPNVQFGSLAGAESGTLGFEVIARDYTTLAKQIVAFRQDSRVKKVSIGTASAEVGENSLLTGVRASMSLEIDQDVFRYKKPQEASGSAETQTP